MLKIDLKPFETTGISHILSHQTRFVSLTFSHSRIEYCNLLFMNSRVSSVRMLFVRFRGRHTDTETVLLPIDTRIMDLTAHDSCCLQTDDPPISIGQGLDRAEEHVTLHYAHI